MDEAMPDWMLPRITDYWDERVEAIERLSRVLAGVPQPERAAQLAMIGSSVLRHAKALKDSDLALAAVPIAEDLYKALSQRTYFDEPLVQYLEASCTPFFRELGERGYTLHYFIDNTWDRLEGPAIAFPMWFRAASLLYICPQQIACHAFEEDRPADEWPALVSKYIARARDVAGQLADRCHLEGRHFVYLDIDVDDFEVAMKPIGKPGAICIFRNEAPVPGSRCTVNILQEPRRSAAPPSAPAQQSSDTASSGTNVQQLIAGLVGGDEESRRASRRGLRLALKNALVAGRDPVTLKAQVEAFGDAGWALIGHARYGEGEYTLTAAIDTLVEAIAQRPELKDWLPLLVGERLKSFMQSPVAELDDAAFSGLDIAIRDAEKLMA